MKYHLLFIVIKTEKCNPKSYVVDDQYGFTKHRIEEDNCPLIKVEDRKDCGYSGVDKVSCQLRQCCWNPYKSQDKSINNLLEGDVPWCYYKSAHSDYNCQVNDSYKHDCGYLGINKDLCSQRKCCWNESDIPDVPWCFYKRRECNGYELISKIEKLGHFIAHLRLINPWCHEFSSPITDLSFIFKIDNKNRARIKIWDKNKKRYEVSDYINESQTERGEKEYKTPFKFEFTIKPFTFKVSRSDDGEILFDSHVDGMESLVFQDQYIEISNKLPLNANIYGLSETIDDYRKNPNNTIQGIWNKDIPTPTRENQYGAQPIYMEMRHGKSHMVFLKNSNGMDLKLQPGSITYKVIGGVLDFYIFSGPMPQNVIRQYTDLVGKPLMPPYWALGFHQCRYGYKTIDEVAEVVSQYKNHQIPLEVMWGDIDYMDKQKDFSLDPINYPLNKVDAFIRNLHRDGLKYVAILDPAIKIELGYEAYQSGLEMDVFLKNKDGIPFTGSVWPGLTHFPDFEHPNSTLWWRNLIKKFKLEKIAFDGLWIDMNEPANFCHGECKKQLPTGVFPLSISAEFPPDLTIKNVTNPPYRIHNSMKKLSLNDKTLDMNVKHHDGNIHYDKHNMYGFHEARSTLDAIKNLDQIKRQFLLSRSTFAGSGKYTFHWTGDNFSTWEHLRYSISSILTMQLYGIPYVGADICGFIGDTTEQLCLRWMQLGAFYPFSRNHNAIGNIDQEPYRWKSVAKASKKALETRYFLLPYLYTLMYDSSRFGDSVWRPMFFIQPQNEDNYALYSQFMLGDALLLAPILKENATNLDVYFTDEKWYNFYTYEPIKRKDHKTNSDQSSNSKIDKYGYWMDFAVDINSDIHIFLRGGHIIPTLIPALTTKETRMNNYTLLVSLDNHNKATGNAYVDDGESIDSKFSHLKFNVNFNNMKEFFTSSGSINYRINNNIDRIVFIGLDGTLIQNTRNVVVHSVDKVGRKIEKRIKFVKGFGASYCLTDLDLTFTSHFSLAWA